VGTGWSELERVGERGRETTYSSSRLKARLVLDCHREPRTLDVEFADFGGGPPPRIIEAMRPFGRAVTVVPGSLAILDRERYFRLYIYPRGVRAVLRKAATPSVFAELVAQLERAADGRGCEECVALCPEGAIRATSPGDIDDARCTACLACVQHHVAPQHVPDISRFEDEPGEDD
jgi:ferredoxin